eukprot:1429286-Amphidinium_carterae.1
MMLPLEQLPQCHVSINYCFHLVLESLGNYHCYPASAWSCASLSKQFVNLEVSGKDNHTQIKMLKDMICRTTGSYRVVFAATSVAFACPSKFALPPKYGRRSLIMITSLV